MSPFVAAIFLLGLCLANATNFKTIYDWDEFDFIWPPEADTSNERMKQNFNPRKVFVEYVAVFGERLFLSLNLNDGIPATLVSLPTSGTSSAPPKLDPFPSWHLQQKGICTTIQRACGLETDPDGRLWVLDDGSGLCPGKIWILDLLKNDKTERVHQFPSTVVSYYRKELRDMVLDKTPDDYLAYITEYYSEHIIVYNRKMDQSWSVKTPGKRWHSLALSANSESRQLYLDRYETKELYSVSVSELENGGQSVAAVKFIGKWTGEPYRMLIDSANVLYAAFHYRNYLSKWNVSEPFREQRFHGVGNLSIIRPYSFALDAHGILWMTQRNETWSKNRYKLLKTAVGAEPYLFSTSTDLKPIRRYRPGRIKSVTTSSWIPVSKTSMRIPTEDSNRQIFRIFTRAPTQHSPALPLTTLSTTNVNKETTTSDAVKSMQTPKSKTGTPESALNSNETSGGCAALVQSQSLNKILIWLLVCCFSCLVLSCTAIAWLTLRMRRMRQISMDNRAEISVFPDDPVYDDVAPENSESAGPENPDESLYAEVHPEPLTSADYDYVIARNPSPEPYEVPLHLVNTNAGIPSEPVYDEVGKTEQENIYDDVGPRPSSGPAWNENSGRKPTESVQYLEVLPKSG